MNPYFPIGPVRTPDSFVGRKEQLGWLYLTLEQPISVNLVGENQYGKTSLLRNFRELSVRYVNNENILQIQIVYLNLQEPHLRTAINLLSTLSEVINPTNKKQNDKPVESLAEIHFILEDVISERQSNRIIVMIDEIEVALTNPKDFPLDFWHLLRVYANLGKVSFIIASRLPLMSYWDQYEHLKRDMSSPFWNVLAYVALKDFDGEEIEELFGLSNVPFNWEEKSWIKNFAGGKPFKLQVACHTLYDLKSDSFYLGTKEEFERAISKASSTFQVENSHPKYHKIRKAALLLIILIPIVLIIPLIGAVARKVGNSVDAITNILVGLIIIFLLVLVLFKKLPLDKLREYVERVLGIGKD